MKLTVHQNKKLYSSLAMGSLVEASKYVYYILMPTLVLGLNASPQEIKLTVSVFFLGFTLSLLFSGPLIDQLGEKKMFFTGLSIFIMGTCICFFFKHCSNNNLWSSYSRTSFRSV